MLNRAALSGLALSLALTAAPALAQDGTPQGVNPRDLVTKAELIVRRDALNGGVRLDTLVLKYDRGLDEHWAAALEVPLGRFSAPGLKVQGLGETRLKFRRVENDGAGAWIAGGEVVLPTETHDELGTGRAQINPSVGRVQSLTPNVFVFVGYQHFLSVAGRQSASDINQSQPRLLAALTSQQGWWLLADFKYTLDHVADTHSFDTEFEAGQMLSRQAGVSLRLVNSGLDSPRRWAAVLVTRWLF